MNGDLTPIGEPQPFTVVPLGAATLPAGRPRRARRLPKRTARVQRAVLGADEAAGEAQTRIDHLKKALIDTPAADPKLLAEARRLELALADLDVALNGDPTLGKRNEPALPGLVDRVQNVVSGHWSTTTRRRRRRSARWRPQRRAWRRLSGLSARSRRTSPPWRRAAEAAGAPWTPGRIPGAHEEMK